MITFETLLFESAGLTEPVSNSAEAQAKAKLTKGLIKVSEDEFWSPEVIKRLNSYNAYGEHYSYSKEGEPLFKGNADFSRGKWRTLYDSTTSSGSPISLKITQADEHGNLLGKEFWVTKY